MVKVFRAYRVLQKVSRGELDTGGDVVKELISV